MYAVVVQCQYHHSIKYVTLLTFLTSHWYSICLALYIVVWFLINNAHEPKFIKVSRP